MNDLELELKKLIISCLHLEDIEVSDINSDEPLFEDGLGLDSIDALELGISLQQKYNIKVNAETDNIKEHFRTIKTLVDFINNRINC